MSDPRPLLDQRFALAGGLLRDAVRVDFARFISSQVEDRLRARPHFFERLPAEELTVLRAAIETCLDPLVEAAGAQINNLRAEAPFSDDKSAAEALARTLAPLVTDETRGILETHKFPSDREADPESAAAPPDYALGYLPSPSLLWAWRELCAIDTLGARLDEGPPGGDLLTRFYLPEAL